MKQPVHVIGVMSGTSLDGLDLACCSFFEKSGGAWGFTIDSAKTIAYQPHMRSMLRNVEKQSALDLVKADWELGRFIGQEVKKLVIASGFQAQFVASHGHTIFHMPSEGYTCQIGNGAAIAAACGLPVVNDFRTADVALGGQGAPLVPIGDKLLFSEWEYCLNLGGIANVSFDSPSGQRLAFDIGVCNMALNDLSMQMGQEYDKNGLLASSGAFQVTLFDELNQLAYFHASPPKSLGKEWYLAQMKPIIEAAQYSVSDVLLTICHHIAFQISKVIGSGSVLVTGGGAYHPVLLSLIRKYATKAYVHVPDPKTVEFKEALIFAFLGLLRWLGRPNCLRSVTGASNDAIGGAAHAG